MSNAKKYKVHVIRKQLKELENFPGNNLHHVREKLRAKIKNENYPDKWDNVWYEIVKVEVGE